MKRTFNTDRSRRRKSLKKSFKFMQAHLEREPKDNISNHQRMTLREAQRRLAGDDKVKARGGMVKERYYRMRRRGHKLELVDLALEMQGDTNGQT